MLLASYTRFLKALSSALFLGIAASAPAGPLGNPIAVNTSTAGTQELSGQFSLAASRNGEKLVMWRDSPTNTAYVQRISSSGALSPVKFPVPRGNCIATDRVGNFAVIGSLAEITLYDRNGNPRANTFRPNPGAEGGCISVDFDGNLSAFYSVSSGNSRWLALRRFNISGAPLGGEVQVTPPSTAVVVANSIASDASGNITVAWTIDNPATAGDIWMQRFNNAGAPLISATPVVTAPSTQDGASLAMNPNGNFLIAWNSYEINNLQNAYVQRYNSAGAALGTPIRITKVASSVFSLLNVSMMEDGSFFAVWNIDNPTPGTWPLVVAQQFASDGTPIGNEFQVDLPGVAGRYANIASDLVGNFTVAWNAYDPVSGFDVKVRSYKIDTQPAITTLSNGQPTQGVTGTTGSWKYFKITVPPGATQMNVSMAGPSGGDGDMYIRFGGLPSATAWDIRPYVNGSNEVANINNPPPGDFYIAIYGYAAYSGVSLNVSYY